MKDPEKSVSQPPKTTYASVRRQRLIGLGSEASVVGFLWVGYILGGAGLGYVLDGHFHTSFLTPALLLFGAVEGFREMMVTVSRLNKNPKPGGAVRSNSVVSDSLSSVKEYPTEDKTPELTPQRRIFSVPAPPEPSFAPGHKASATVRADENEPKPAADLSSSEDLIKQLLNDQPDSPQ